MTDIAAHAELSPSAADRWLNCTASVKFSRGYGGESSAYADEGTAAHEKLELWLSLGVPPVDGQLYYELLPTYEATLKLEEQGYGVEYEVRVRRDERLWGTVDIKAVRGPRLRIIDYKHGYVPVDVRNNPQLLTYVLCDEEETKNRYSDIEVAISQPRIPHRDGTIRWFTVTRELLDWHTAEVSRAIREIDSSEAKFMPGKWCRYCPRGHDCRVATNYFAKLITGKSLL